MFLQQKLIRFSMLVMVLFLATLLFGCGGAEEGDLIPPNVTFDGGVPSVTSDPGTALAPHAFTGTSDPGTAFDVDIIPPAGGVGAIATVPVVQPNGDWSFDVYSLDEGLNQIGINASDPVGNTNILFVNIVLDLTGAVATLNQFMTPTSSTTQTLAGTVAELNATAEISLDAGVTWPITLTTNDIEGGIWSYDLDLLVEGTYDIWVRGVDKLGNTLDPADPDDDLLIAKQQIIVDTTTPAPTLTINDTVPYYLSDPADVLLSGTRESGYTLTISHLPATACTADVSDLMIWTCLYPTFASGSTVATYSIDDGAGSTAKMNFLVIRDQSGPLLIDTVPVHGNQAFQATDPIEMTFSETMASIVNDGTIFELQAEDGTIIPFTTDPATSDFKTFIFTPDPIPAPQMQSGTKYTVNFLTSVAATVEDEYGNDFVRPTTLWTFTTQ